MLSERKMKIIKKYRSLPLALKASVWFFLCTFIQKGISVITTPIFTRLMTTEEYGVFSIYGSWSDILSIFITFGLSSSVYQKKIVQLDQEAERDRFTSSIQGLATLTAALSLICYLIFHKWINRFIGLSTDLVLTIYLSILLSTAFGFWSMRQRVEYKYKRLVSLTLITFSARPLLGIIGIKLFPEHKVYARIITILIVEVIAFTWIFIKQFVDGKHFFDKKYWKYAIVFVIPLIPHFLSQRILSQSDRVMINDYVGESAAGIYSLAHSIGWLMTIIITALDYTIAPWTYQKLHQKNTDRIKSFSVVPIVFMALGCFAFITCAPEIILLFAPKEYREAMWLIPPLVVSTYFMMVYTMFIYIEYFHEKTKSIMVATISSAMMNIILNYIFIRAFGYQAAAYTSLVCYILYSLFHYFVFRKICLEHYGCIVYDMKKILFVTVSFVVASFVMMSLYQFLIIRVFVIIVLFIIMIVKRREIQKVIAEIISAKKNNTAQ